MNAVGQQIGSLSGNGNVGFGTATLIIDRKCFHRFFRWSQERRWGRVVTTGTGSLTKNGTGVLTLAGANDISVQFTLNAGGITVNSGADVKRPYRTAYGQWGNFDPE
jgi:autotransporter-associated beta strand protein